MVFDVRGKVALVTGANRGIGKAIVETLLDRGAAKVYAAVRDASSATPLVEAHGEKVVPVRIDLNEPATITEAAAAAGDVQLVVNNAGILKTASALDPKAIEALQAEIEVNVYGLIRMAQAFAPVLKESGGGAFVQLNSIASLKCFPDFTTYCASKAAAYLVTQGLKDLLAEQGTAVLSVHPGPIDTDMAHAAGMGDMADSPEKVAVGMVDALSAGKFHLFPDTMAEQIGSAYASFAENVVEAE